MSNIINSIDESIYETADFKIHEYYVLPIIKEICFLLIFQKENELLAKSLSFHKSLDELNQSQNKDMLVNMIDSFNKDSSKYLGKNYNFNDMNCDLIISEFIPNDNIIKSGIERQLNDLNNYCNQNNVSKKIRDTYVKIIEKQKANLLS